MQLHRFLPGAGLVLLTLSLTAGAANAGAPESATVVLARDFMFAPVSLTVQAGSTVTWTNKDEEPHTVVSDTGLFRSGAMDTNESFSYRFEKPGTYHYLCSIHPRMSGTIIVR
jgi:plastocyanin